jgi:auxin efflux carrier family protein
LTFAWGFLNAPLIGALIGGVIGLAPPLHRAFFNEPSEGGIFKAWLTASVKDVGDLFAALQLVVVGAKLSGSLLKMKKGEASGQVKVIPMLSIFFIRFILWPM